MYIYVINIDFLWALLQFVIVLSFFSRLSNIFLYLCMSLSVSRLKIQVCLMILLKNLVPPFINKYYS